MLEKLCKVDLIENYSGVNIGKIHRFFKPLRKGYYYVLDFHPGGDAPKDFIRLYKYGEAKKKDVRNWPKYIAKVGHKWYPIESITEYLLNRIGQVLGLKMSESELWLADNQLRFLSKYFLKEDELMIHGAQIYSVYLNEEDQKFVEQVEREQLSSHLFTFQFTLEAIRFVFPDEAETIIRDFVSMLIFDAITGNNDRHFYNWAVVLDVENKKPPAFSPIYDTARGLFWNQDEKKLLSKYYIKDGINRVAFEKYLNNSMPKIGWEGQTKVNHFYMIERIIEAYPEYSVLCKRLTADEKLEKILAMLKAEFTRIFSKHRYLLIEECIKERFFRISETCKQ